MHIADSAQNALVVRQEATLNAVIRGLNVGSILHARVVAASAAPDGSGRAILEVRGQQLQARTAQPLTPGELVNLEVTGKAPGLVLRRLDGLSGRDPPGGVAVREQRDLQAGRGSVAGESAPGAAQAGRARAAAGYQGNFGKSQETRADQSSIVQRESVASRLSTQRPLSDMSGAGPLSKLLVPLEHLLKPDGLAEALRHSGHFLEARLASRGGPGAAEYSLDQDLKSNLLRARTQTDAAAQTQRAAGGDVTQDGAVRSTSLAESGGDGRATLRAPDPRVEQALARIEMNQLMSLGSTQAGAAGALAMLVELPVRFGNEVRDLLINIGPDEPDGQDIGPGRRTVRLQIELPRLGLLVAELQLGADSVDVGFWAEHLSTRRLVSAGWETLAERLRMQGLAVGRLSLLSDKPRVSALERLPNGLVELAV